MSGQTGPQREQCKVAVFHFTRNKLSDPDPNAPVVPSRRLVSYWQTHIPLRSVSRMRASF